MSKITRFAVLAASLLSLFAVLSSTAGAVTWTNSGSTTVHATSTGGARHIGSNSLSCSGATATATAAADFTGSVYSVPGTVTFSPCTLAGQATFITCGFTLTGSAFASGVTSGMVDVTCDERLSSSGTNLCHIEGATPGHYINPSATPGRITLTTSTTLIHTHSSGTSCLLGTGPTHLTEQTFTVTSVAGSPVINRVA